MLSPSLIIQTAPARQALQTTATQLADREAGTVMNQAVLEQLARREAAKKAVALAVLEAGGKEVAKGAARITAGKFLALLAGPVGWVGGAVSAGVSFYFDYKTATYEWDVAERLGCIPIIMEDPKANAGEVMRMPTAKGMGKMTLPSVSSDHLALELAAGSQKPNEPTIGDKPVVSELVGDPNIWIPSDQTIHDALSGTSFVEKLVERLMYEGQGLDVDFQRVIEEAQADGVEDTRLFSVVTRYEMLRSAGHVTRAQRAVLYDKLGIAQRTPAEWEEDAQYLESLDFSEAAVDLRRRSKRLQK